MPTARPRITITLTAHSHEVLARLAAASGDSMSEIVAGFVDLAVPSLERVVVVLERARAAPEEVRVGLRAALDRAERDLIPTMNSTLDQADMFLAQIEARVEPKGPKARAAAGSPPAVGTGPKRVLTPVPVTRGSGLGKTSRARGTSSPKRTRGRGSV